MIAITATVAIVMIVTTVTTVMIVVAAVITASHIASAEQSLLMVNF